MRRLRGCGFVVAGNGVEAHFDARGEDELVVREPIAGRQRDRARPRIDGGRFGHRNRDAGSRDLIVAELLIGETANAAEYASAERRRGIDAACFDQRNGELGIGPAQRAGAARPGKAAADDDNARRRLRDGGA